MLDTLLRHLPWFGCPLGALRGALALWAAAASSMHGEDDERHARRAGSPASLHRRRPSRFSIRPARLAIPVRIRRSRSSRAPIRWRSARRSWVRPPGREPRGAPRRLASLRRARTRVPRSSRRKPPTSSSGSRRSAMQPDVGGDWRHRPRDRRRSPPLLCTGGNPGDPTCPINIVDISELVDRLGRRADQVRRAAARHGPLRHEPRARSRAPKASTSSTRCSCRGRRRRQPIPDTLDRYFNVKMNLKAGDMPAADRWRHAQRSSTSPRRTSSRSTSRSSRSTATTTGGGGGMTTAAGCKKLASFKTNAQGPLQTSCASCHANARQRERARRDGHHRHRGRRRRDAAERLQPGRARASTSPTRIRAASSSRRTPRKRRITRSSSAAQANFDTFKAAVDVWVQAEKTSQ